METQEKTNVKAQTKMWQKELSHAHDVMVEALEGAGFRVTVVEPGPTTSDGSIDYAKNPAAINEPVIFGIVGPNETPLSLSLNVTP